MDDGNAAEALQRVLLGSGEVDDLGVPLRLLGPHPTEVWGAIARTIALGALIENRIVTLLQVLTGREQNAYAKDDLGKVVKALRTQAPNDDPAWADWSTWLDRAENANKWRNDLAHNLWPAQPGDRFFGWRLGRNGELVLTESTHGELRERLTEAAGIAQDSERWTTLAGAISGDRLRARREQEARKAREENRS
ncbi:hypothetical protein [Cellulomonas hominis]